jgi:mitofusin
MQNERKVLDGWLGSAEDGGSASVGDRTRETLLNALERVRQSLWVDRGILMPPYSELLNTWEYASDVRRALLASLDAVVKAAEEDALRHYPH